MAGLVMHPEPPYTDADDIAQGAKCYYNDCDYTGTSWGSVFQHVRSHHKRLMKELKGTFLHTAGNKDINAKQIARRIAKPTGPQRPVTKPTHSDGPTSAYEAATPVAAIVPDVNIDDMEGQSNNEDGGYTWKALPCWVKCKSDGAPCEPLEIKGLVTDSMGLEGNVKGRSGDVLTIQMALGQHRRSDNEGGQQSSEPIGSQLVARKAGTHISDPSVMQPSSNSGDGQHPLYMLTEIYDDLKDRKDTQKWVRELPDVRIKDSYMSCEAPPCKWDGAKKRALWPKDKDRDYIQDDQFAAYIIKHLNKKGATAEKIICGAGRALGFLEVSGGIAITDVKTLIGLFKANGHMQLLESPMLHPRYYWTPNILHGLINYASYHYKLLIDTSLQSEAGPFVDKYTACLNSLMGGLKAGHLKRCQEFKDKSIGRKCDADRLLLKKFPSVPRLQEAVEEAYMMLKVVADYCKSTGIVTRKQRFAMNAAIAGGYSFDTFGGRKWELEHANGEYIGTVLANDQEFFVCKEHKTSKCYGDLAKLLTPGLFAAFACYKGAPRPNDCMTFLVPSSMKSPICYVPKAFMGMGLRCL